MNLKGHFSRFFEAGPECLHYAAHSHHPWPDVSFEAHQQAWLDAAAMADDKWDHVFGEVIPSAQGRVASVLGLAEGSTLTFGPNTHSFLVRLFSCLEPPVRVLSTDHAGSLRVCPGQQVGSTCEAVVPASHEYLLRAFDAGGQEVARRSVTLVIQ